MCPKLRTPQVQLPGEVPLSGCDECPLTLKSFCNPCAPLCSLRTEAHMPHSSWPYSHAEISVLCPQALSLWITFHFTEPPCEALSSNFSRAFLLVHFCCYYTGWGPHCLSEMAAVTPLVPIPSLVVLNLSSMFSSRNIYQGAHLTMLGFSVSVCNGVICHWTRA